MARIPKNWQTFRAPIEAAKSWNEMQIWLHELEEQLGARSVYVIRTCRPFAISYPRRASPVLYIGQGNVKVRLRDHMRNWIAELGRYLLNLNIEVRFQQVIVTRNVRIHKDVEADLINRFESDYGSLPAFNRRPETNHRIHIYEKGFYDLLNPGRGRGYHWSLTPLASNAGYPAFIRGAVAR